MERVVVLLLASLLFLCFFSGMSRFSRGQEMESVVYVDFANTQGPWDGTSIHPFQHIQEGINAVGVNGTVYIADHIYPENITIHKSLRLIGENKSRTILDGAGYEIVVYLRAQNVTVSGLTVRNGRIGMFVNNSWSSTITGNTFRNNNLFGVYLFGSSYDNLLYGNTFLENTIHAYDIGVNFWDNGSPAGGNYWDDYDGNDTNNDGFGERVYNISGGTGSDSYPLIAPLTVFPVAHFSFAPSNPTTQDVLQFTDNSIDSDGYIVFWRWDFGDNTNATNQTPTHRYSDDGDYPVMLTVTDDYGATNTIMRHILVTNAHPVAAFEYNPKAPTDLQDIVFIDSSFDHDGVVVSWLWDFGDNNTSSVRNPTHRYRENGTYQVTLKITDNDGASNQILTQIDVLNVAPLARFSYNPTKPTTKDTIQFTDTSSDGDGTILSWVWDFGDGMTSTTRSPSHVYSKANDYTVSLRIVDNDGASSTEKITVSVRSTGTGSYSFGNQFNFVYILYIVLFIIMVGVVIFIVKKYR